ncbi:MAG: glycosyltransferase family 4 protein [Candidatus Marsarchaeota archaeon]|nr:glycosyltransferase family 4 protein [Candidatus Marsarchaeota archaeon]
MKVVFRGNYSSKPRILVLARVFPPRIGGIENYMYNIYSRLAAKYDMNIIAPTWPGHRVFDQQQTFKVIRSPRLPLLRERYCTPLIGMLLFGLKEVLVNRPDQIHCDQIETAIVGRLLAAVARAPYLVYAYGMEITDNNRVQLKRWAMEKARAVITISENTSAEVLDRWGVEPARIRLVYPGVDVNRFHPRVTGARVRARYGINGDKVILTTGRLAAGERYKGHDTVIECMPTILNQIPNVAYLVVGDGPDRWRIETLARKHNLDGRVVFAGAVPEEELPEFYAACDVFVMPSREGQNKHGGTITEGFGIVFLEAGASGKPVVGTRVGGIPDAVVDGVTGLLVTPGNKKQLAEAIIALLQDPTLEKRLGEAARSRAEQEFQWDFAARRVSTIVDELGGRS